MAEENKVKVSLEERRSLVRVKVAHIPTYFLFIGGPLMIITLWRTRFPD